MRILIGVSNRSLLGGAEHYLCALIPGLQGRGHEVALLYEQPGAPADRTIDAGRAGLPCWCIRDEPLPALLRRLDSWDPGVVYLHGLLDAAVETALVDRFPAVLFAHNYYGTCIAGTKYRGPLTPRPCTRRFGLPCLALYLPCGCGGRNPATMWREYRRQARRCALLGRYRMVLVASRHMEAEYTRHGIDPGRLHRVPLFPASVWPDADPPRPRPLSGRILFSGRVIHSKGVLLLVDALAGLGGKWTLVVAGNGPDDEALRARTRRRGVRAEFLGHLGAEELERQRRAADLVAVPSLGPEPFGLVGVESGCVGLPSVGFCHGGISDWLIPGETGEAPADGRVTARGLAEAITRAVGDAGHHQRLRLGAWQMAQRFTRERHLDALEPLLERARR
jgi:glycosyltransferase involved in cell wall biosynthesis